MVSVQPFNVGFKTVIKVATATESYRKIIDYMNINNSGQNCTYVFLDRWTIYGFLRLGTFE